MPWTFFLFHCSSPYDGRVLPFALLNEVRTFLPAFRQSNHPQNLVLSIINHWIFQIPYGIRNYYYFRGIIMNFKYTVTIIIASVLSFSIAIAKETTPAHGSAKVDPGALFPQPKMNKTKSTLPSKTELIEPAFMAQVPVTNVTLKWNAIATAENYHLQVATDPNFKWLKVDENFVKRPSFDVTGLEAGKKYYWRVAAVKNSNDPMFIKGPFETSSFETK